MMTPLLNGTALLRSMEIGKQELLPSLRKALLKAKYIVHKDRTASSTRTSPRTNSRTEDEQSIRRETLEQSLLPLHHVTQVILMVLPQTLFLSATTRTGTRLRC